MTCEEVMKRDVKCSRPGQLISELACTMRDENIGFTPVCDESGRVIGTVTDRDLVVRAIAEQRSTETTKVEDVMTREVVSCKPSDDLSTAEDLMKQHRISRLVCTDERGCALGVISLSDVARVEAHGRASDVLRSVTEREAHT